MKTNKEFFKSAFKFIVIISVLVIAYLYVLNGRYSHAGRNFYFDKWTEKVREIPIVSSKCEQPSNVSCKWLYDKFKQNGLVVGKTFEEFDRIIRNNEDSRKWAFEKARDLGCNVGESYEDFERMVTL